MSFLLLLVDSKFRFKPYRERDREREREFLSDLSFFLSSQFDFDFQIKEPKVYHSTVDGSDIPNNPPGMYKTL